MSSTVSLPSEMMPTLAAMALAVMGWSPVTMITCGKSSTPFTSSDQCRIPALPGRSLLTQSLGKYDCLLCLEQKRQLSLTSYLDILGQETERTRYRSGHNERGEISSLREVAA